MRRHFWSLLNAALLAVVIGQVWSIQTCPSMTSPTDCETVYPAGCGVLCTASYFQAGYWCCCDVNDPVTGQRIGCCEAWCDLWTCTYIGWGANCGWDVNFDGQSYNHGQSCNPSGSNPMEGYCYP